MATLDNNGREILDQTPRAIPLRALRNRNRTEDLRALVRQEMSRLAQEQGHESFEEADDFEVGDDFDPDSPYELGFDPEISPQQTLFQEEQPVQRDPDPASELPAESGKSDAE